MGFTLFVMQGSRRPLKANKGSVHVFYIPNRPNFKFIIMETEKWVCSNCFSINDDHVEVCRKCGLAKGGFNDPQEEVPNTPSKAAETSLLSIAQLIYWGGSLCALLMFVAGLILFGSIDSKETGIELLILSPFMLLSSYLTSHFLRVICNISNELKKINNKMK